MAELSLGKNNELGLDPKTSTCGSGARSLLVCAVISLKDIVLF